MFPTTLLTSLLLALSVAANPIVQVRDSPVNLPLARRFNITGTQNILQRDQQRAKVLKARAKSILGGELSPEEAAIVNQPLENQVVTYIASVGVGTPATTYSLLVDTGSSNTWVGAGRAYVKTSSSVQTTNRVAVTYGSGSFSGNEFTDTVTLGSLVITGQSIGVATRSSGFEGTDGILGIGPVDLTTGTLSPATGSSIPTVTDNLFSKGLINANEIGISFQPTTGEDIVNGQITWGGTDSSKFTGTISSTPHTSTEPATLYWGINQSVSYGSTSILSSTAGIVDTGTTLVLLASNAISRYQTATGAVLDNNTGLLRITASQFASLQGLNFITNGVTHTLTANAQIWPRALNADIGGVAGDIYLIVGDLGTPSGEGFDFVNGFGFLQRFYSVFNTADRSVGFATTPFTTATTN